MNSTVVLESAEVAAPVDAEQKKSPIWDEQELEAEYAAAEKVREGAIQLAKARGAHTSVWDARMIMGDNFIGLDEVLRRFDLSPFSTEVSGLEFAPYPEKMLSELSRSYLLVAGFPVDFIGVRQAAFRRKVAQRGDFSYDGEPFAQRKMAARWYLVAKEIARNSLFRTKADQDARIFSDPVRERLGAVEMAYIVSVYRLVTGKRLFQNVAALTSDSIFTSDGETRQEWGVFVGFNDPEFGIAVGTCPTHRPMTNIGAAVSIRPCFK